MRDKKKKKEMFAHAIKPALALKFRFQFRIVEGIYCHSMTAAIV